MSRSPGGQRAPSVPQLRALVAVAEHLHFRDAAAAGGVSQPALSAAVSSLEETLGVQLVERTTRRVLLTPAGERVAAHAREVLEEIGELVEAAASAGRAHTGPLRVGIIPTVAPYLLPTLLGMMRRRFPAYAPRVHEEQTSRLLDDLAAGRLDVGVLALPTEAPGVTAVPLYEEDFALVVPEDHAYAGRRDLRRSVLRGLDMLLLDEGHCLRDQALDVCREAGAATNDATHAASLTTATQLVAGGLGATLLPESAVSVETRRGRLSVARFAEPPTRTVGLVHRATSARGDAYAELATAVRRAVHARHLPVRVLDG